MKRWLLLTCDALFVIGLVLLFSFSLISGYQEKFYTSEDFKNIFLKEMKKKLSWVKGDLYIEKIKIEPEMIIIPSSASYEADFINPPKIGSNLMLLKFKEGKNIKRVKIWGYVDAKVPVVVLQKNLPKGSVLNEEDLILEFHPYSRVSQDVVLDKNRVVGKEIKMSLKAGTILRYSYLQSPLMIRKNQIVDIIAIGRNFVVKARGIALQEGREGEKIKVKNISSKKILWGKVISSQEVEAIF